MVRAAAIVTKCLEPGKTGRRARHSEEILARKRIPKAAKKLTSMSRTILFKALVASKLLGVSRRNLGVSGNSDQLSDPFLS